MIDILTKPIVQPAPPLPPFFCLTLAEEPWKQESANLHFQTHGITPTFIHGFHGMLTGLRPTHPFQFNRDGTPEYIHVQQVGCALSQIVMLKVAIACGAPEFIVCEDDIQLCEDFTTKWSAVRAAVPDDIDCIQLEYIPVQYKADDGTMTNLPMQVIAPGVSKAPAFAHCSACTWWRRPTAMRAVQMLRPIDAPYDIMLTWKVYPFVGHALATPPLARQRTAYGEWPSSIGIMAGKIEPPPLAQA